MKTPSIVGAQPRGKVVCAAACSSQLGRMSTNFGCGSRARACSGYVRASLAWCYLQSTLFNQIHVLQRKKDYTAASELYQSVLWAPPLAAQICLDRAYMQVAARPENHRSCMITVYGRALSCRMAGI